jgi:hypothetical protein
VDRRAAPGAVEREADHRGPPGAGERLRADGAGGGAGRRSRRRAARGGSCITRRTCARRSSAWMLRHASTPRFSVGSGWRGGCAGCVIVVGCVAAALACGWWQCGQAGEGGGQRVGPRRCAAPVAQRLGFAGRQFAVERAPLGPGDQVLGDQRELEPDGVVVKVAEGQVLRPGLLAVADAVARRWRERDAGIRARPGRRAGRSTWPKSGGLRGR